MKSFCTYHGSFTWSIFHSAIWNVVASTVWRSNHADQETFHILRQGMITIAGKLWWLGIWWHYNLRNCSMRSSLNPIRKDLWNRSCDLEMSLPCKCWCKFEYGTISVFGHMTSQEGERVIEFGYSSPENGFNIKHEFLSPESFFFYPNWTPFQFKLTRSRRKLFICKIVETSQ